MRYRDNLGVLKIEAKLSFCAPVVILVDGSLRQPVACF